MIRDGRRIINKAGVFEKSDFAPRRVDGVVADVRSHIAGSVRGSLVNETRRCKLGGRAGNKRTARSNTIDQCHRRWEAGSGKAIVDEILRDRRERKLRNKLLSSRTGLSP